MKNFDNFFNELNEINKDLESMFGGKDMSKLLSYFIEQEETKEFEHCSGDTYYILPTKHEHVYFTLNFDEDMQLVFHCYNKDTNITFEEFKALEFLIDKGWK